MKKIQLVFAVLCLLAPVQAVRAAPPAADTHAVFGAVSLPCIEQASQLLNRQLARAMPDQIVEGLGRELGSGVVKGTPRYDKARIIVAQALASEEKQGGPFFNFNADKLLRNAASGWSASEKAFYTGFFASPAGRLYLTDMLDGATCRGWLKKMNAPPFSSLSAADEAQRRKLLATLDGGESRFLVKLNALPKEEQQRFAMGFKKLGNAFESTPMQVTTQDDASLKARIDRALAARRAAILAAAGAG